MIPAVTLVTISPSNDTNFLLLGSRWTGLRARTTDAVIITTGASHGHIGIWQIFVAIGNLTKCQYLTTTPQNLGAVVSCFALMWQK